MCSISGSSLWDQSCPQEGGEQVAMSGLYLMLFLKDSPPPLPWKLVVTPYDLEYKLTVTIGIYWLEEGRVLFSALFM